ncbi:hypothetical protein SNE40_019477 [Patella caerulea]|uniref:Peroxin-7 n=1 Tax=Patella caerulea TaxID=87958 RepID=A0AAN8J8K9_PATCE
MNLSFKTNSRHGYSVKFSPYFPHRIACATSQYYGIAGCGTLFILDTVGDQIIVVQTFDWKEGLFDVTWAENNENIVISASGDGTLQIWDINQPKGPLRVLAEHTKEVNSIDWSQTRDENLLLSGSWDGTIKLWDIFQERSLSTYKGHDNIVYSVNWSPRLPSCFASGSGDQTVRVWDARKHNVPATVIPAHQAEILTCDWSKYDENIIISGGVDGIIRCWDIRKTGCCLLELLGHQYAVRRIKTSPFVRNVIASCSYDFSVRIWDLTSGHQLQMIEHHTEFVYGLDWNLHIPGQIADCSWDEFVRIYQPIACLPAS